jgi:plastocyanin
VKSDFLIVTLKGALDILLLAALVPCVAPALGGTNDPIRKPSYEVRGYVTVLQADPKAIREDLSGVVVWLTPKQPTRETVANTEPLHYRMVQIHKALDPHMLVVPVGSIVEFPNNDPWFHNIFSVSRGGRFDLGFYAGGTLKSVKFNREGVSYLFCSIHPETMGIVVAVTSSHFGISDKAGYIAIGAVPPGKYLLRVWYQYAAPQTLEALRRNVVIGTNNRSLPRISVALSNSISEGVKNQKQTEPCASR